MDYTEVSKDQQRQILKGRIAGWEADHFGHEINLLAFEGVGDAQGIEQSRQALSVLETSINAGKNLLASLDG